MSKQCKGITKKGERCKIYVKEGGFCRYHQFQQNSSTITGTSNSTGSPKKSLLGSKLIPIKVPGRIYVYTLQHLLVKPTKEPWLKIQKYNDNKLKVFNPKHDILIKIGYTTQSVHTRLKQWEFQCKHQLLLVNPYNSKQEVITNDMDKLLFFFKKMSLNGSKQYLNYENTQSGFLCLQNANIVESKIHQLLRQKYGHGNVHCNGCIDNNNNNNNNNNKGNFNIHIEWFLIPRKEIDNVFKIIDRVCSFYNNNTGK
ncbi:hypothetical protein PACTADRAFT_14529 [Pachysolen tannophilus NRRL Y-2460]|uniref:Bacteriophage T5 Orf172 DNA-binding domain-containing protein n=1 Tax=Pachysolen tannophilus NRRL Y-2460 TaxID=669874 RepID=A0A1E4U2B1_PACTA|nr:hypothetical protein PACTADRAFT_14529 [Pachysolen tannophilus NRRL Y-2460]